MSLLQFAISSVTLMVLSLTTDGALDFSCPVTDGTDMPVKDRLRGAPIVVHASCRAAKSSVGFSPDHGEFYSKGYYYRLLCVLKNTPAVKIRHYFSVHESGWASCRFHTQAVMASDVILTLNVTEHGRLTFYDHDLQAAGHDVNKTSPRDVVTWLGDDAQPRGPSCP